MTKRNITFVKRVKLQDVQNLCDEEIIEWHKLPLIERLNHILQHNEMCYALSHETNH
ncbi:MAG: hypothetical protein H6855_02870 [Rhodospirillales bacterium]|nr:hypothetical protein [Rhodospirillales bacterium]MCB9965009.1 hypothetical protein [Rhodospirillales bacterium]MCB9980402.1 hypothetical protein [Rhodospirillales bacterium]